MRAAPRSSPTPELRAPWPGGSDPPEERRLPSNGLAHHVLRWAAAAPEGAARPAVVLCHGFLDFAWSWLRVAERLAAAGHEVFAFDFRGHGETDWVGPGGYYHFYDYVLDMDGLLPQLSEAPVHLVGHSMGGTACALFASVRPERLLSLSLVEGIGPPAHALEHGPDKLLGFLRTVRQIRAKDPRPVRDVEQAYERMRRFHPSLEPTLGRFLAAKAIRPHAPRDEAPQPAAAVDLAGAPVAPEAGFVFRYDPLHRSMSPTPFRPELFREHLRRVGVPALYVAGGDGFRPRDEAERLEALGPRRVVELPGVGHMIHRDAPGPLAQALLEHFAAE